jgi:hypothetical protein
MFKLSYVRHMQNFVDRGLLQVSKVGKDGRQNSAREKRFPSVSQEAGLRI